MPPTRSLTPSPTVRSPRRASPLKLQANRCALPPIARPPASISPINSPAMSSPLPPFTVPIGWTTELSSHEIRREWEGSESLGQTFARCYGLGPATPVMEDNMTMYTIFQSNDKFYLWERIDDDLYEFACRDIREISLKISQSRFRNLRIDLLEPLPGANLP